MRIVKYCTRSIANGILATPVDGVVCQECQAGILAETLKCSKRKLSSHIRCSELPTWLITIYVSSVRQYVCEPCQHMTNFHQKLRKFKTLVEAARNRIEKLLLIMKKVFMAQLKTETTLYTPMQAVARMMMKPE